MSDMALQAKHAALKADMRIDELEAQLLDLKRQVEELHLDKEAVPMTAEQAHTLFLSFMAEPNWSAMDWYFKGLRDSEAFHNIKD